MKVLKHKLGNQEIYSTPDIEISLGNLKAEIVDELQIDDDLADELFKNPKKFMTKKGKLIDKIKAEE